jgi:hypothetical protein
MPLLLRNSVRVQLPRFTFDQLWISVVENEIQLKKSAASIFHLDNRSALSYQIKIIFSIRQAPSILLMVRASRANVAVSQPSSPVWG